MYQDRLIVFDLDGTLVDTLDDLTASANRLLATHDRLPIAAGRVRLMVGDGIAALVRRVLAYAKVDTDESAAMAAFGADYEANAAAQSRLFPGVAATLLHLRRRGFSLAVCTNKPVAAAQTLLAALEIAPLLAAIGGGDSFAGRKPDPAHLLGTVARAGGAPSRAIMVGDHANDVAVARACAMPCVFALWGYGPPDMAMGSNAQAETIVEVPALAERLLS
ncbi:HAD-IA family hydrolase [Lichenicoccus sp.]|uniref:HAD-IA family hydrolase n=1 Tax=Lichenicoccus sp. TaxID=2781899 RepID=UPI003D1508B3